MPPYRDQIRASSSKKKLQVASRYSKQQPVEAQGEELVRAGREAIDDPASPCQLAGTATIRWGIPATTPPRGAGRIE